MKFELIAEEFSRRINWLVEHCGVVISRDLTEVRLGEVIIQRTRYAQSVIFGRSVVAYYEEIESSEFSCDYDALEEMLPLLRKAMLLDDIAEAAE